MHAYDEDIQLRQNGAGRFQAAVSDRWSINETPDGGYLMALLAGAALETSPKNGLSILTANFIARSQPGPAEIVAEPMGASRRFDRWQVSLFQEGAEKIRSMVTLSDATADPTDARYEKTAPALVPPGDCVQFGQMPGYTLFDNMDVLLDPDCAGWTTGKLGDRSELRGWIKFKDDRTFDASALLLVADAFPPPVFVTQGMVAWVPTLEMSVNIRNRPQTRWLKCVFRTRFLNGGMVEEDGEIWDEAGELAAISRQVAQYRKT
ncbi:MAG: TesB-like acyl-CoA thioesterase 3 [Olavius algarvensis Delta 4 endosymbiont]|nr:MAG: TesB-like acyl-CoA thioesterase 3 [Olavius algarvensis Delta 4 endosymbiont]